MANEPQAKLSADAVAHMNEAAQRARAQLGGLKATEATAKEAAAKAAADRALAEDRIREQARSQREAAAAKQQAEATKQQAEAKHKADLASAHKKLDAAKAEFNAAKESAGKLADKGASTAKLAEAENKYIKAAQEVQVQQEKVDALHRNTPEAQAKHEARQQAKAGMPEQKPAFKPTPEEKAARLEAVKEAKAARAAGEGARPLAHVEAAKAEIDAAKAAGDVAKGSANKLGQRIVKNAVPVIGTVMTVGTLGVGLNDAANKRAAGDEQGANEATANAVGDAVGAAAGTAGGAWAGAKAGAKLGLKAPGRLKIVGAIAGGVVGGILGAEALKKAASWLGNEDEPATSAPQPGNAGPTPAGQIPSGTPADVAASNPAPASAPQAAPVPVPAASAASAPAPAPAAAPAVPARDAGAGRGFVNPPLVVPGNTAAPAAKTGDIIVQKDDSLSLIVQKDDRLKEARAQVKAALGDGADNLTVTLVLSMALAKKSGIEKPDLIHPGKVLTIPSESEIKDAVGKLKLTDMMKDGSENGANISGLEFKQFMKGKTTSQILG